MFSPAHDIDNGRADGWEVICYAVRGQDKENQNTKSGADNTNIFKIKKLQPGLPPRGEDVSISRRECWPRNITFWKTSERYLKLDEGFLWRCHACGEKPAYNSAATLQMRPTGAFRCENCRTKGLHGATILHCDDRDFLKVDAQGYFQNSETLEENLQLRLSAKEIDEERQRTEEEWLRSTQRKTTAQRRSKAEELWKAHVRKEKESKISAAWSAAVALSSDEERISAMEKLRGYRKEVEDADEDEEEKQAFLEREMAADNYRYCFYYKQIEVAVSARQGHLKKLYGPFEHALDRSRIWTRNAQNFLSTFARRNAAPEEVGRIQLEEKQIPVQLTQPERALYEQEKYRLNPQLLSSAVISEAPEERAELLRLCSHFGTVASTSKSGRLLTPVEACQLELRTQRSRIRHLSANVLLVVKALDFLCANGHLNVEAWEDAGSEPISIRKQLEVEPKFLPNGVHAKLRALATDSTPESKAVREAIKAETGKSEFANLEAVDERLRLTDPDKKYLDGGINGSASPASALRRLKTRNQSLEEEVLKSELRTMICCVQLRHSLTQIRITDFDDQQQIEGEQQLEKQNVIFELHRGKFMQRFSAALEKLRSAISRLQFFKQLTKGCGPENEDTACSDVTSSTGTMYTRRCWSLS